MKQRRGGFALLAALWLVVAIATVALQFAIDAKERRDLGAGAADRTGERGTSDAAVAIARARLERKLRNNRVSGAAANTLRASDPWLDVDTLFQDTITAGNTRVLIHVEDLDARLNLNDLSVDMLHTFFGYVLNDYATADALSQAVMDWEDPDDLARPNGAEREQYLAGGQLVLPPNRPFRDVEELRDVTGMTPAILDQVRPYLTTLGTGRVNVNTAPAPVLRALPGMTDQLLGMIMSIRAAHQKINSINDILPGTGRNVRGVAGRGGRGGVSGAGTGNPAQPNASQQNLARYLVFNTSELLVTAQALGRAGARVPPRVAVVQRVNGTQSLVTWESW